MILEFHDFQSAQECLEALNQSLSDHCGSVGYCSYEKDGALQLVGKNTATGLDAPEAAGTLCWDVLQESPDGTYYFESPSGSKILWRAMEEIQGFDFTERAFPEEWRISEDGSFIVASLRTFSARLLGVFRG